MTEHDEQVALFAWAEYVPELELLYAIPNGGKRPISVAKRMKAEGMKSGVLDICLPVPRGGYHGLYLEMKFGKNKMTDAQRWWFDKLTEQGYICLVAYSFEEAKRYLETYLESDPTDTQIHIPF